MGERDAAAPPRRHRFAALEAYKGSTVVCLLALQSDSVPAGGAVCSADDCNFTQGVFFLEHHGGWWWLLNGVVVALSMCAQLEAGVSRRACLPVSYTHLTLPTICSV